MSVTDRLLYTGASCAMNAMSLSAAGDPVAWPPRTVAVPAVGRVRPTAMFISVDLPAPFGPTSAARDPSGTARVQSCSAQDFP